MISDPETDINIKDLVLTEPTKLNGEKFDPQKELFPSDWQREKELLAEDVVKDIYSSWATFFGEASMLKFIDPKSLARLGINLADYQFQAASWFREAKAGAELPHVLSNAFDYKFLYPQKATNLILPSERLKQLFDPEFHLSATQANALLHLYYLDSDLAKSTGAFEKLHSKFISELTVSTGETQWKNHHDALMLASALKILYPDEPISLGIIETLLKYGRDDMEQGRQNPGKSGIVGTFQDARNLLILTADRVTIEDGQFKFENKSDHFSVEKPPETRRF